MMRNFWQQRLPDWKPGVIASGVWTRPDCTFTNDSLLSSTGRVFHVAIFFTPKWPGAFTADIIMAESSKPFNSQPRSRWPEDIPSLATGSYRIGWFVAQRDIWWRLFDDAAESRHFFESIPDCDPVTISIARSPDHWYAPSYSIELPDVMHAALSNLTDTFENHVLPKLEPRG